MRSLILKSIKATLGHTEYLMQPWRYAADECLVLCLHSTPEPYLDKLRDLVMLLRKDFHILGPKEFQQYMSGALQQGPYILFSFDDGLRNNFKAAQLLHSLDVHAYFFIVPHFVQSEDQKAYYLKHIRPQVDPTFERDPIDFEAMSMGELQKVWEMGHALGSHTLSHDLRADMPLYAQREEIVGSKQWLEERLNLPIDAFCSPNNTNFSVSADGCRYIADHYRYHFTTFPGLLAGPRSTQLIYRRNIEVNWSLGRIRYALGKWDLKRWIGAITEYQKRMRLG